MSRASRELFHTDPELILIPEDRQRKQELSIDDLIPSISARGILLPLLLRKDESGNLWLVAGWRRLKTALFLKLVDVPFRLWEGEEDPLEIEIIELEENAKRKDLTWQDKCAAMFKIHLLYQKSQGEDWSVEQSASSLGYHPDHFHKFIRLGEALLDGDENVAKAETMANATTLLSRRRARETDSAVQRILERATRSTPNRSVQSGISSGPQIVARGGEQDLSSDADGVQLSSGGGDSVSQPEREPEPPYAIISAELGEFVAGYAGPKFNFLHADLPYGVELGPQANQDAFEGGGYESNAELYFHLTDTLLKNWEKFMFHSSHVMWWFAHKFRFETEKRFEHALRSLDVRIQSVPLIWHKTDNRGILPDAMRGPRNIGEYALLISTGDRKIVRPVANIYGAPTAKGDSIHVNEKPEPMLSHFFSMLVDGHSRVFDPTAGSGSAIRVAESIGAEAALGLELNPDFAARAQDKLLQARRLARLSKIIKNATDKANA